MEKGKPIFRPAERGFSTALCHCTVHCPVPCFPIIPFSSTHKLEGGKKGTGKKDTGKKGTGNKR
jgi:hypothetical protein